MTGDAAWDNFVASIDPVVLQREHAGPGDLGAERPWSREDHEMRFAHDYVRRDFWRKVRGELSDVDRARMERRLQQLVDRGDQQEQERLAGQDSETEAAIARYALTHSNAAAAAQSRGHAA
ncbi:hypothetical protein [Curtobacterium sp. MWU13-2055]|uniref:hypothetical protein n=1 Tax=Curtobacterium sp. MWU13-2055 TaxID=2931928 RepID=UPI0020105316|nr:hypothetical protein [Curtobacterium sp. MWU13-2055]